MSLHPAMSEKCQKQTARQRVLSAEVRSKLREKRSPSYGGPAALHQGCIHNEMPMHSAANTIRAETVDRVLMI